MPLCKICTLPSRTRRAVDAALFAGLGYRKVVAKFSTRTAPFTLTTVARHRQHAFPEALRRQPPPPDAQVATKVLDRIEGVIADLRRIADSAQGKRMPSVAIAALKEVLHGLELIGKSTGELPGSSINFNIASGAFTEEQLVALLTNIKRRPEVAQMFSRLLDEHFGRVAPVIKVGFVKPQPQLSSPGDLSV